MVLSTLFTLFRTGAIILLLNDYFKREYPERYNNFIIEFPLYLIYLYSKGQIMYGKLRRQINEFIDANPHIKKFVNDIYKSKSDDLEIEYIVDGKVSEKYKRTQSLPDRTEKDGSLLIFSDLSSSDKCIPKKIIGSEIKFDYKVSNIQFMLVEVKLNDNTYKINLKTDLFNYYIVDNVLDRNFFRYYLLNYIDAITGDDISSVSKYIVKIIDQNVAVKEFDITDTKFITIKENEYTVSE
jgi:hypothetical protein